MTKVTYTKELLESSIKESFSLAQTIRKIGLIPAGGNYKNIKLAIKKFGLDISHFTGQGHLKGKTHNWSKEIPLLEILVKDSTYSNTYNLKHKLFKKGILENKCQKCGITKWQDKEIAIHLDHINGDNMDHRLENLRLLCPNCHSQTDTYCGKNKKKKLNN